MVFRISHRYRENVVERENSLWMRVAGIAALPGSIQHVAGYFEDTFPKGQTGCRKRSDLGQKRQKSVPQGLKPALILLILCQG